MLFNFFDCLQFYINEGNVHNISNANFMILLQCISNSQCRYEIFFVEKLLGIINNKIQRLSHFYAPLRGIC